MTKIKINKERCKGCYLCVSTCPNGLIKVSKDMNTKGVRPIIFLGGKPARLKGSNVRSGGCTGCSLCAVMCPDCVIEIHK